MRDQAFDPVLRVSTFSEISKTLGKAHILSHRLQSRHDLSK
jgi:hypothetical protein